MRIEYGGVVSPHWPGNERKGIFTGEDGYARFLELVQESLER
jgi:hypothetical protein